MPTYALNPKINEHNIIVKISKPKVLSIDNTSDITDEISGKERPNPTPAPQIIALIYKMSRINL